MKAKATPKPPKFEAILKEPEYKPVKGIRIHQVVLNADLRLMLPGLLELCRKLKLRPQEKDKGQLIVFINSKRDYLKVLACNHSNNPVLACYRLASGRIYDLNIVAEIPSCFRHDQSIDFDEALKLALTKKLGRPRKKTG